MPKAKNIVSDINRLATALRSHGGTVAWVYTTFTESTLTDWNAFFGAVYSAQFSCAVVSNLFDGSDGHRLWHELDIHNSDLQVSKNRFSAFLPDACDLKKQLHEQGIDTVINTGTVTNVCCESSAGDALMQKFKVLMAHDANAAQTDVDHNASMNAIVQTFGDVMSTNEVIALLPMNLCFDQTRVPVPR